MPDFPRGKQKILEQKYFQQLYDFKENIFALIQHSSLSGRSCYTFRYWTNLIEKNLSFERVMIVGYSFFPK